MGSSFTFAAYNNTDLYHTKQQSKTINNYKIDTYDIFLYFTSFMKNSKLYQVIATLTDSELKSLGKSLGSELFKTSKGHIQTFNLIAKSKRNGKTINRSDINIQVYQQKVSDTYIRNVLSDLYKLVEKWIVVTHAISEKAYSDRILLRHYRNHDQPKLFTSYLSRGKNQSSNRKNAESIDQQYELLLEEYNFKSSHTRTQNLNIQELLDLLDVGYLAKKLRQVCFSIAHQSVSGNIYDKGLLDLVLSEIEDSKYANQPAINLYHSAMLMLSYPLESEHFVSFKANLDTNSKFFPDEELRSLYLFAINQCIRMINRGEIQYGRECLALYHTALEKGYFLLDGYLSRFTYKNVAAIAIKIGDYDWAEKFSAEYKSYLRSDEMENSYHLNLADVYYQKKNYDEALNSLQKVNFSDHLFNLTAKTIQMKIYYETEAYNLLDSHLDAMQMYLLRKKVIGYHKNNYKNVISYTKRLVKCNPYDRDEKKSLSALVENEAILSEKKWLLNQLS